LCSERSWQITAKQSRKSQKRRQRRRRRKEQDGEETLDKAVHANVGKIGKENQGKENIIWHSAKCSILTKKGTSYCTIPDLDNDAADEEERCFRAEFIEKHDYYKIFAGSTEDEMPQKPTFRERKIINYENRLRAFSTPDKLFRYFATLASYPPDDSHSQHSRSPGEIRHDRPDKVFMNAEDFLRSLSPGVMQPLKLGLDQYRSIDRHNDKVVCNLDPDSIFYKMSKDGLLKFTDYMFLMMVLTHPKRHFRMAFNLFDEEGDGLIKWYNFRTIEKVLLSQTKMGRDHRDHGDHIVHVHKKKLSCRIAKYFFGDDLEGKVEIEKFMEFQTQLKMEVNSLEFDSYRPDANDSISAMQFVDSMTRYINGSTTVMNKVKKMKKNMRQFLAETDGEDPRVTRDDFLALNEFFRYPVLMKLAFKNYHKSGFKVSRKVFQMNAKNIAGVDLSDNIVTLLYVMMGFYKNDDVQIRFFRKVVKTRTTFGLKSTADKPSISKKLRCMARCLGPQYQAFLRYLTTSSAKADSDEPNDR